MKAACVSINEVLSSIRTITQTGNKQRAASFGRNRKPGMTLKYLMMLTFAATLVGQSSEKMNTKQKTEPSAKEPAMMWVTADPVEKDGTNIKKFYQKEKSMKQTIL